MFIRVVIVGDRVSWTDLWYTSWQYVLTSHCTIKTRRSNTSPQSVAYRHFTDTWLVGAANKYTSPRSNVHRRATTPVAMKFNDYEYSTKYRFTNQENDREIRNQHPMIIDISTR